MNTKTNPTTPTDDLSAVVRAAAWAWYERGSGASDTASAREYDATRRRGHATPRPSRYKLEAMRLANKTAHVQEHSNGLALLDAYEIESISRQLDNLIGDQSGEDNESLGSSFSSKAKKTNVLSMRRRMRGFWMKHAAAVCGARDGIGGVVEMGKSPRRVQITGDKL